MRLFFALWPPRATAEALYRWASGLASESGGRVTVVDNIHLTLAFLGEADPVQAVLAAQRAKGQSHRLPIDMARYVKRNEMVWVGPVVVPAELASLANDLGSALRAGGFKLEERPFAVHVTLIRKARMPKSIPPLPRVEWPVDEFLLMRSRTSPRGSTYEAVERFSLS